MVAKVFICSNCKRKHEGFFSNWFCSAECDLKNYNYRTKWATPTYEDEELKELEKKGTPGKYVYKPTRIKSIVKDRKQGDFITKTKCSKCGGNVSCQSKTGICVKCSKIFVRN